MAKKRPVASRSRSSTQAADGRPAEPDLRRAVDLVMQLMAIPGKSGQEGQVADFVEKRLRKAGAKASMIQRDSAHLHTPFRGETGNLIMKLPGTYRGPRRMFSAHLDTVPICVGCEPVRRKRIVRSANPDTGLGADDRAGVGAILTAAVEILEQELPHPPLTFCWFVQEEVGLQGSRVLKKSLLGKPQLAFNWDGGAPEKLTVGATGGYRMEIVVRGVAAHAGGAPEWGVNAIAVASIAIADLQKKGWHGLVKKGRLTGTSNVGVFRGGQATNVVTDRVELRAEARSHDSAFRKRILDEIEKAFQRAAASVKNVVGTTGSVEFKSRLDYESFSLEPGEPCVVAAAAAVRAVGREPVHSVANGGVDANWITHHGIPAVTIGCGQRNQHMVTEELDLDGYEDACRIALRLATAES
jgi:tripeptide aminopeptidase